MRRLFCYTLSARAIGATVSAGALHAQGWGFESLIAHHRIGDGHRKGTVFVWARRSGSGRRSRTRHPSSPTTRFDRLPEMGAFRFSDQCRGIRTRKGASRFKGSGQKMSNMSTATFLVTEFSKFQRANLTSKRITVRMGIFLPTKLDICGLTRQIASNLYATQLVPVLIFGIF